MLGVVRKDKELMERLKQRAMLEQLLSGLKSRGHASDGDTESDPDTDAHSDDAADTEQVSSDAGDLTQAAEE